MKNEIKELPLRFKPLDVVRLNDKYKDRSESYKSIIGKDLVVKQCSHIDLGDMITETIRFFPQEGIQNPYLANHFDLKEE